ncbi:hypothetical protein fh0823_03990 [Francisella halioticida]|uniref:Transposase IS200-like domain-containing protein n=1 Tax=Francisella halioticida TaxID=549298 RepID=A0ABM6LYI6_9GAMM|nr:hypothetical protein [Francisella halioticida]ASG67695.1 hypothetical protein CDV26_04165 [Francisella halioticida]BCD90260.1 hypothetical protein fh0823_03990 [Francisella halioticida]
MEHKKAFQRKNNCLEGFDYLQYGYYYVTICTKDRISFCEISSNDQMVLNDCGKIVFDALRNVPKFYEYVSLDEFIVMFNHIHVIVIIQKDGINVGTEHYSVLFNSDKDLIVAHCATTTNRINLFQIIKSYKNICTKQTREYIKDNPAKWRLDKYNCENQCE